MEGMWQWLKENLVTIFFGCPLFLLLLVGESSQTFGLYAILTLFLISFGLRLDWKKVAEYRWELRLWAVWLVIISRSWFTTIHRPLTLMGIAGWLVTFLFFNWTLLMPRSLLPAYKVLKATVIISTLLALITLVLMIYPVFVTTLPTMNLVTIIQGHTHLAALLLLTIPVSWWLIIHDLTKGTNKKVFSLLIPMGLTTMLVLTMARFAMVIGLVQLLTMMVIYRSNFRSPNHLQLIWRLVVGLYVIGIMVWLMAAFQGSDFICQTPSPLTSLCRSAESDHRLLYWERAVKIWHEYPLFGSGLGTFAISSSKYQQLPATYTTFAHNAYLQMFSDLGMVGGVLFIVLLVTLISKSMSTLNRKNRDWRFAVVIGIGSMFINLLFDFDFDFIGIKVLTFVYIALLLREINVSTKKTGVSKIFVAPKILFVTSAIIILLLGAFFGVTQFLIQSQQVNRAFAWFPYFYQQRKVFTNSLFANTLVNSPKNRAELEKIYAKDPEFLRFKVLHEKNKDSKLVSIRRLYELEPLSQLQMSLVDWYLDQRQYQEALAEVNTLLEFTEELAKTYSTFEPYTYQRALTEKKLYIADRLFQQGAYKMAGQAYKESVAELPWILQERQPPFVDANVPPTRTATFILELGELDSLALGEYREAYYEAIVAAVKASTDQLPNNQKTLLLQQAEIIAPWKKDEIQEMKKLYARP